MATAFQTSHRPLAWASSLVFIATLLFTGFSHRSATGIDLYLVSGQITLDGRPAAGAQIVFHPQASTGQTPVARAQADAEGNYRLSTYSQHDGAPAGVYTVTVELRSTLDRNGEYLPGPSLVPAIYGSRQTSRLTLEVAAGDNNLPINIHH